MVRGFIKTAKWWTMFFAGYFSNDIVTKLAIGAAHGFTWGMRSEWIFAAGGLLTGLIAVTIAKRRGWMVKH